MKRKMRDEAKMRWALPPAGLLLVEQSGRPGTKISKPVLRPLLFVAQIIYTTRPGKMPPEVIHIIIHRRTGTLNQLNRRRRTVGKW